MRERFVVCCFPLSINDDFQQRVSSIPRYLGAQLGGLCQTMPSTLFSSLLKVCLHARGIDVLVYDSSSKRQCMMKKLYRSLYPAERAVSYLRLADKLIKRMQNADHFTDADLELWVNRQLLPEIGFKPLAGMWNR